MSLNVEVANGDRQLFFELVDSHADRIQLAHHATVLGVGHCLLVMATTSEIMQVVKVNFAVDVQMMHLNALKLLADLYLCFVKNEADMSNWPSDTFGKGKFPDLFTLKQTIALRGNALDLIDRNGQPLPKCLRLIPSLGSTWNNSKGPVDSISQ